MFLKIFFKKLEEKKIYYAVMRNYDSLPETTNGSDLDVLFLPKDAKVIKQIVSESFAEAGGQAIGETHTRGFSKYFSFGRQEEGSDWWGIRLDLSFGHIFRGCVNLLDTSVVLKKIDRHKDICVLPGSLANVLGVLKELLHSNRIPLRYAEGAKKAFENDEDSLREALSTMGPRVFKILRDICVGDVASIHLPKQCHKMRRALMWYAFQKAPISFISGRISFGFSKIKRLIFPPGLMLAILGTDGSGKSTIIGAISPILGEATHGAFYQRHLRPGLLPPLGRMRGQKLNGSPVTNPHGSKPSGVLGSILRITWLWLDYMLGYWLIVRPKISKSPAVFLFDRYAHDIYLDPKRFRIKLPEWILKIVPKLAPMPDIIICLHGDPKIIADRKKELPLEEVQRQIQALRELAEYTPGAVLISTNCNIEKTSDAVLTAIQDYLEQRNIK
ncbi:MAG: hypothetical protein OCD03_15315 [Hyphomicrobiales bacterium]